MKNLIDRFLAAEVMWLPKANIFFFVFEYCYFRIARHLLMILTTSHQFHLLVNHNLSLEIKQDPNLWFFCQTIRFDHSWVRGLCRSPDSPRRPRKVSILKNPCIQTHVSPKLQAWFIPPKIVIKKFLLLEKKWVKNYRPHPCIETLNSKSPEVLIIG